MSPWWLLAPATGVGLGAAIGWAGLRRKGLHRWLLPYLRSWRQRRDPRPGEPVHVLLCICDHFEPKRGGATAEVAHRRVRRWVEEYPKLFGGFRDSDGRPPRHTFFYPAEEYEPRYLEMLAELCRAGYGEVEVHLHHDNDTAENLRRTLLDFKQTLADRHGLLARGRQTSEVVYGFIHGNWALDNARSDGRYCGVNNELDVLRETGCYADFTLPSAPSETQTRTINSVYYARGTDEPKSHDRGRRVRADRDPQAIHDDDLLLLSLLTGFPDRVARRRSGTQILLANGISAELAGTPPPYAAVYELVHTPSPPKIFAVGSAL